MKPIKLLAIALLTLPVLTGCGSDGATYLLGDTLGNIGAPKPAPTPTPPPAKIGYADITVNTVPQGAAIIVNNQSFGYSPVVIHARTINSYLDGDLLVIAMPTGPGQFKQWSWIGFGGQRVQLLGSFSMTFYMYDSTQTRALESLPR